MTYAPGDYERTPDRAFLQPLDGQKPRKTYMTPGAVLKVPPGRYQIQPHGVPDLAPLLKTIETPHRELHESAKAIQKAYARADTGLPEFIARKEIDHLNWTATIQTAILENKAAISVQTDHTKCGFGKWLYGEAAKQSAALDTDLDRLFQEIKAPHEQLHGVAKKLIATYAQTHPGIIQGIYGQMDFHRKWAAAISDDIMEFRWIIKPGHVPKWFANDIFFFKVKCF